MYPLEEGIGRNFEKNCQCLGFYSTYKLSCHCSMDAGRRHEIPGSKTKDFITYSKVCVRTSYLYQFTMTLVLWGLGESARSAPRCMLHRQGIMLQQRNTELGGVIAFIERRRKPPLGNEILPLPSRLFADITLRSSPGK